jgi:hypothetical protein
MKRRIKFFIGIIIAVFVYYLIYFLLFLVKINKTPLITYIQKELIIDKDLVVKTFNDFDNRIKYDYIVLGSSHAYRSFDPKLFENNGISMYNFGSSSQTPLNSYCLLKKLLPYTDNFILEIYPIGFNLSGKEAFMVLANVPNTYKLLLDMSYEMKDLRAINLLSIKPFIDHEISNRTYNYYNCQTFYKGYSMNSDSVHITTDSKHEKLNLSIVNKQIEYLIKMINLCNLNNKKLTFVYAPIPKLLTIAGESSFLNRIKKLSKENKCKLYDFHRMGSLHDLYDFYDSNHLNKSGVEKFNSHFIKELLIQ